MAEQRVASAGEIPDGEIKGFDVDGSAVAIANVGGTLHAFENDCKHKHCALDDGEIEDGAVVCSCHGSSFSLESGDVVSPPADAPIAIYPVRVDGEDVLVDLG